MLCLEFIDYVGISRTFEETWVNVALGNRPLTKRKIILHMFDRTLMNVMFAPEPETTPLFTEQSTQAARTSYQTYFNAFPASYWQNNTNLASVILHLEVSGYATASIYKSNHLGEKQLVSQHDIEKNSVDIPLPLTGFEQGGFYWFDIEARSTEFNLVAASWRATEDPIRAPKLSIGITTYNKPDYCVQNLQNIASDSDLLKVLDSIYLVDQGTQLVQDEAGIDEVSAALGDKLKIIRQ